MTTTATCPAWCTRDHAIDSPEDFFHRSHIAKLAAPESASFATDGEGGPRFEAHLVLPEGPEGGDEPPQITVDADVFGPYAELDVEHADQFIRDLKTFTARMQQMRDQLAAIKKEAQR